MELFCKGFSGMGCQSVEVYDRPTFQQLDHLFREGFADLEQAEAAPGQHKIVYLAYCGHGQNGNIGEIEAILDSEENFTFPIEGWLQHLGKREGINVVSVLQCSRAE